MAHAAVRRADAVLHVVAAVGLDRAPPRRGYALAVVAVHGVEPAVAEHLVRGLAGDRPPGRDVLA